MTERFVGTEVDRTKSRWVAKVFREFCRPRTTIRALYYYALRREEEDYPICGGFVGEIRIVRRYHENDGAKLPKWVDRARLIGYLPEGAILDEVPGEQVFPPSPGTASYPIRDEASRPYDGRPYDGRPYASRPYSIELWMNRSALIPLMLPICGRRGVTLVSIGDRPSNEALELLYDRAHQQPALVLCLSDLSIKGLDFCRDLAGEIAGFGSSKADRPDIKLRRLGLTPGQVRELQISMVPGEKAEKKASARYKKYLKPHGQNPRLQAELDALEVYYPGGIARFIDDRLSDLNRGSGRDDKWLLDLRAGLIPGENDVDYCGDEASA